MSAVGIICEYNPFHEGHRYHIQQARKNTGADYVVAIMNGDFVQRGEPAIVDKYIRTQMALQGGADLVFELPVRYGISSASDFAYGGILALNALSFVDFYCFGSEEIETELLMEAGKFFAQEPKEYQEALGEAMRGGLSFPAAREEAFCQVMLQRGTKWEDRDVRGIFSPNNILAIEYMKAAAQLHSKMKPVVVRRKGMGYNDEFHNEVDGFLSATAIRQQVMNGISGNDLKGLLKEDVDMLEEARSYMEAEDFWTMCGYAIREKWEKLERYKDVSGDMANAFRKNWYHATSFMDFAMKCKTKNLTMSRIKRAMFQVLLGVEKVEQREEKLPYIRLLGMRKEAAPLLGEISETILLGRLAKDKGQLDESDLQQLEQDVRTADLYRMAYMRKSGKEVPEEYRRRVIVL